MRATAEARLVWRLLLVLVVGVAAYLLLASVALAAFGGSEQLESWLYVGTFVAILPVALVAGTRTSARLERTGTAGTVTVILAAALALLLVIARGVYAVTGGATTGTPWFAAAMLTWMGAAAVLVRVAGRGGGIQRFHRWASTRRAPRVVLGILAVAFVLGFPPAHVLAPPEFVAGLVLAAALAAAYLLLRRWTPNRRWGALLDVAAVFALVMVANDLNLYVDSVQFYTVEGHLHENFYLGPANDVLHGRPMLVETFSQYGVGLIYGIVAWSKLTSLGYGSMTLLTALVAAAEIAAVYVILRLARASRPLALAGGGVAGLALFFAGDLPEPTDHPSLGGLRYLPPYLVVIAAVLDARSAHPRRWWWLAAALVGLSSVWSFEAFGYCTAAFAGIAVYRGLASAPLRDGGARAVVSALLPAVVAVGLTQAAFTLLTVATTGSIPDWGGYIAYLGSYSVDGISALPIEPWTPAVGIIAGYFVSLAALVMLLERRSPLLVEERPAMIALAGVVPFGVVSFTYFIGNSFPDAALLVGIPCYLAAGLWLTVAEHHRDRLPTRTAAGVLAVVAWMLALVVVFAAPTLRHRAAGTPLALAVPEPGGQSSLTNELERMWRSDPLDARNEPAKALARRYFPGRGPLPVVATSETTVTVLMESGRLNAFPVSHYLQESLVMDRSWPRVRRAIDRLGPGSLVLVERRALDGPVKRAPLLRRTVSELQRRFRLELEAGDPNGFFVARLEPRR